MTYDVTIGNQLVIYKMLYKDYSNIITFISMDLLQNKRATKKHKSNDHQFLTVNSNPRIYKHFKYIPNQCSPSQQSC